MHGRSVVATVTAMEAIGLPMPMPTSSDELRSGMQWWTYRSDKAERELGWEARPHEETLEDTVRWQLDQLGKRAEGHQIEDAALRVTGAALRMLPFGGGR
jgi:dihydroflavonol-4-reductase